MYDRGDIVLGVAARGQQAHQQLQIGDRVEVARRLLAPEAAVEVGAERGVACVAGQLADVIDLVGHVGERNTRVRQPWRSPITQPGLSIHASSAAPITPPRAMIARSCASLNWRWLGTSARQLLWVGEQRPAVVS